MKTQSDLNNETKLKEIESKLKQESDQIWFELTLKQKEFDTLKKENEK